MHDFKSTAEDLEVGKEWAYVKVVVARGILRQETRGVKDEQAKLLAKTTVLMKVYEICGEQ